MQEAAERSKQLIEDKEEERRRNYIKGLSKRELIRLMQSVELDPRLTTVAQVERAKEMINRGKALDVEEVIAIMDLEASTPKNQHHTDY
ncbi:MAG: hypothetical protein ACD_61C00143G0008 [uncultured bacterium]|nr:MAG: hypothetical protein ACD_61C00143G0008 [uncultured bacterium]